MGGDVVLVGEPAEDLVGPESAVTLCDLGIFADQAAEPVMVCAAAEPEGTVTGRLKAVPGTGDVRTGARFPRAARGL